MSDHSAAPAASLREQIARAFAAADDEIRIEDVRPETWSRLNRAAYYRYADAVLALPALREAAAPAPAQADSYGLNDECPQHADPNCPACVEYALESVCAPAQAQVDALADRIAALCEDVFRNDQERWELCADAATALRARSASPAPAEERIRVMREKLAALDELEARERRIGSFTDTVAFNEWNRRVTLAHRAACEALDAIVPGASDTLFFGVSNAAASPAPTQPEGSETRETLEVASLPDPSGLPNAQEDNP